MADERMSTLEEYRAWLGDKVARGVKDVRAVTALNALPVSIPTQLTQLPTTGDAEEEFRVRAGADRAEYYDPKTGKTVVVEGMLVGTAEAAGILGVERPRIGRWQTVGSELLPPPVARLAAGPVWLRSDIEALRGSTDARRKPRG